MKAAVVDTTLPYKNVQAAVRMFGEKSANVKLIKSHEKHEPNGSDIRDPKEELIRARIQLANERKQTSIILSELNALKKEMEACRRESTVLNGKDMAGNAKEVEQQHLDELQELKTQRDRLEQELSLALEEKEHAQRQAEEALAAAEMNAKRADELSQEILGTKESLLLVKMACIETNKEREALWAVARKAESNLHAHTPPCCLANKEKKLEHMLSFDKTDFPKEDWRMVRQCLVSAREALQNIDRLKAACGNPASDETIALELEVVKSEVCKALERDLVLEMSMKDLQHRYVEAKQELDAARFEFVELNSREASADEEIGKLRSELEKVRGELKAAVSCNEAFVGFSQRLQQESVQDGQELACKVIDDAKAELHALLEEEVQAVRQAEMQKTSQAACLNRLEAIHEDSGVVSSVREPLAMPHDLPRESSANVFDFEMQDSYKEEHKRKKFSLSSLSTLLSKSKRSGRREMDAM